MAEQTVGQAIRDAAARLAATSDTARLDAEVMMAHALGTDRSDLLLRRMADAAPAMFAALIDRRARHEPVAHIIGHQDFFGLRFAVTPDVLIPRSDSEVLIEAALAAFASDAPRRILDLGTGSGCLLLAALSQWPDAVGIGIERSPPARAVAVANAHDLNLSQRACIVDADWLQGGWSDALGAPFDLVLANPPYVETAADLAPSVRDHEPASALFAGPDGLDDYRVLVPQLPALLTENGVALVEIGHRQSEPVTALAEAAGLSTLLHKDLAGRPRALEMRKNANISLGKQPAHD